MNDHSNSRHRISEPAWPGDEPDAKWPRQEEPQERTGFWSPLWEDDDEPPSKRPPNRDKPPATPAPEPAHNGHNGHDHSAQHTAALPAARTTHLRRPAQPPGPAPGAGAPQRPPGRPGPEDPTVVLPGARRPRDTSRDQTEVLAPVRGGAARREPELLTHREGELEDELDEDLDLDDGPLSDEDRRKRRKKIWRRIRRTMYVLIVLMILGPVLAFLIAYQTVDVPSVEEIALNQSRNVTLQYADGSELAKIVPKDGDRTIVKFEDLPEPVLNAVFAAEDATFMSNAGFDISGVMRAGWNQVSGGSGGGSTITQQYVKKSTGEEDKTLSRKALEVVKAYKMNRTYSKEDIITAYLNTVYFGRNAYGIAAAGRAYYAKDLKALTASESALLAGMIQSPGRFKDEEYQQRRWNYVMDQLVANKWFPAEQRKAEQFPTPLPYEQTRAKAQTGPPGLIQEAALDEVERVMGVTREEIQRGGFTIVTTIDPQAQALAQQAVTDGMKGLPEILRPALVAVDPKTGQIKAYYGGADGVGTDWAAAKQEPGSSFKPFDLVALLQTGKGLGEVYDGSSPRTFRGVPRRNSENAQCQECTVAEAMKRSINTVFFDIALNTVNTQKVAEAAAQAGITSKLSKDGSPPTDGIAIGGDDTLVSTVEMASSYATFAARGTYRAPHLVSKVLNANGSVYWQVPGAEKPAFDANLKKNEQIARNVTEALLPVPTHSNIACAEGRQCAGKTGTHQLGKTGQNSKAWMVGYTPQISTAVSLSADKGAAIEDAQGGDIFGARVPGKIWKKFMDSYHKTFNLKKEDFGRYEPIGKAASGQASAANSRAKQNNSQGPRPSSRRNEQSSQPQEPTTTTSRPRQTRPSLPGLPPPGDGTGLNPAGP